MPPRLKLPPSTCARRDSLDASRPAHPPWKRAFSICVVRGVHFIATNNAWSLLPGEQVCSPEPEPAPSQNFRTEGF